MKVRAGCVGWAAEVWRRGPQVGGFWVSANGNTVTARWDSMAANRLPTFAEMDEVLTWARTIYPYGRLRYEGVNMERYKRCEVR
jgi:hypothetical protein